MPQTEWIIRRGRKRVMMGFLVKRTESMTWKPGKKEATFKNLEDALWLDWGLGKLFPFLVRGEKRYICPKEAVGLEKQTGDGR